MAPGCRTIMSNNENKKGFPTFVEKTEVSKALDKAYKKFANGFQRPSILLSLEPRMMFDGAAPAVVDDIIDTTEGSSAESLPNPEVDSEEETAAGDDDEESESQSSTETSTSTTEGDPDPDSSEDSLFNQLTNNASDLIVDPAAGLDNEEELDSFESTLDDIDAIAGLVETQGTFVTLSATAGSGDHDTDSDGILDIDDLDSDNDGISDADEGFAVIPTGGFTDDGNGGVAQVEIGGVNQDLIAPSTGPLNTGPTDTVTFTDTFGGTTEFTASVNGPDTVFTTTNDLTSGVQVQLDAAGNEFIFLQPIDGSNPGILDPVFDINNPGPSGEYQFTFDGETNAEFTIGGINNADTVRIFGFIGGVQVPLDASDVVINDADLSIVPGTTDGSLAVTSPDSSDGGILVDTNDATFTVNGVDEIIIFAAKSNASASTITLGITNISIESVISQDSDGDGIADHKDLDSDNDGISDLVESGANVTALDLDANGVIDGAEFADADSDGLADVAGAGTVSIDTDSDGTIDVLDQDSDSDGIADLVEGQDTAGLVPLANADADSDGIDDAFDNDPGFGSEVDGISNPEDTDSDGAFDFLETDSDSDGIADSLESTVDSDGDGEVDFRETDSDSDGIADSLESTLDSDGDGTFDFLDTDSDSDGIADSFEGTVDSDSDGISDFLDTDSDSDGIADSFEGTVDSDSDGTPNFLDTDSDNDGIPDDVEGTIDTDSDGTPDFLDTDVVDLTDKDSDGIIDTIDLDDDNDGILDVDEGVGEFVSFSGPLNGTSPGGVVITASNAGDPGFPIANADTDLGDTTRFDNDNFTFLNSNVTELPSTGLFIANPPTGFDEPVELDFTGTPVTEVFFHINSLDGVQFAFLQSENPGLGFEILSGNDFVENFATIPGDVIFADNEPSSGDASGFEETLDGNGGGSADGTIRIFSTVGGNIEELNFRIQANDLAEPGQSDGLQIALEVITDSDGDGIANHCDLDSDNDGISDLVESGADAALFDSDGNGVIDGAEFTDADSDGLADGIEAINGDNVGTQLVDTDNDGINDLLDLDSDNDGIADVIEGQETPNFVEFVSGDSDSDGIADVFDGAPGFGSDGGATLDSFSSPEDTDSDGTFDFRDTDSDGDGISDELESGFDFLDNGFQDADSDGIDDDAGTGFSEVVTQADLNESDSDGEFDFRDTDSDSDGIADSLEGTVDTDSDGTPDFLDTDSDSDGIPDSFESTVDSDSDGTLDFLDTDSDSDGIPDSFEATADSDSDGTPDFQDTDSDSDGIPDSFEGTVDSDSDGTPDF